MQKENLTMKNEFYKETEGIYRLRVPFDRIYTSVFLVVSEGSAVLVDCATTDEDVDLHIVPALRRLGYDPTDVGKIVLTHRHRDHAGGLAHLLTYAPNMEVVTEPCEIASGIVGYPLPGHTVDSLGVLDGRSHTLISGDGLQGAGVDKYRCGLKEPELYLETLEQIRKDERIENILFSHAYEPWNSDRVFGRDGVLRCLDQCRECMKGRKI